MNTLKWHASFPKYRKCSGSRGFPSPGFIKKAAMPLWSSLICASRRFAATGRLRSPTACAFPPMARPSPRAGYASNSFGPVDRPWPGEDFRESGRVLPRETQARRPKGPERHIQVLFGRMNDDVALFAGSDAFRANPGPIFQRQMHDAAFPRGHGIQLERLLRFEHAFGGHPRRHAQFLKAKRAKTSAIEMNFFMVSGLQPKSAKRQVLERFQNFTSAGDEDLFVLAIDICKDFRFAFFRAIRGLGGRNLCAQIKRACPENFL